MGHQVTLTRSPQLYTRLTARRGRPVAHKIYGIPQTINTANYVYFLAFQELRSLSGPDAVPSQTDLISIITCASVALTVIAHQ